MCTWFLISLALLKEKKKKQEPILCIYPINHRDINSLFKISTTVSFNLKKLFSLMIFKMYLVLSTY